MSTSQAIESFREAYAALRAEIGKVIVGHQDIVDGTLTALFAGGHVLLEGVPGLGKTLLVRTLSEVLDLSFSRIQFTPDLMPADILGTNLVMETPAGRREFQFQRGPIFAHLILADEINRATPKTQSALLEAMQEHQVTAGGELRRLVEPFFVMATQNPIDQEGTYPLPEAQLDRFFFKILVGYPSAEDLAEVLTRTTAGARPGVEKVLNRESADGIDEARPRGARGLARAGLRGAPGDGDASAHGDRLPYRQPVSCVSAAARAAARPSSWRARCERSCRGGSTSASRISKRWPRPR